MPLVRGLGRAKLKAGEKHDRGGDRQRVGELSNRLRRCPFRQNDDERPLAPGVDQVARERPHKVLPQTYGQRNIGQTVIPGSAHPLMPCFIRDYIAPETAGILLGNCDPVIGDDNTGWGGVIRKEDSARHPCLEMCVECGKLEIVASVAEDKGIHLF